MSGPLNIVSRGRQIQYNNTVKIVNPVFTDVVRATSRRILESAVQTHRQKNRRWREDNRDRLRNSIDSGGSVNLQEIDTFNRILATSYDSHIGGSLNIVDLIPYLQYGGVLSGNGATKSRMFPNSIIKQVVKDKSFGNYYPDENIAIGKPDDTNTGFRCCSFLCPHCNQKSNHVSIVLSATFERAGYTSHFGNNPFPLTERDKSGWTNLKSVIDVFIVLSNTLNDINISGYNARSINDTKPKLICTSCFEETYITSTYCDCSESIRGVSIGPATDSFSSASFCALCGEGKSE
jgi:hypothetical protein